MKLRCSIHPIRVSQWLISVMLLITPLIHCGKLQPATVGPIILQGFRRPVDSCNLTLLSTSASLVTVTKLCKGTCLPQGSVARGCGCAGTKNLPGLVQPASLAQKHLKTPTPQTQQTTTVFNPSSPLQPTPTVPRLPSFHYVLHYVVTIREQIFSLPTS